MATIEKKIRPEFFETMQSGAKNMEIRIADFRLQPGDTMLLREWDPATKNYTGRTIEKTVSFVNRVDLDKIGDINELRKHGFYLIELE